MSLNTTRFALTYPEDSDPPDGPSQIQDLAGDVETRLGYAGARGGKSIVTTEQNTASASFVELGTPDRVQGIDLPTDGLILVRFLALFKNDGVAGQGLAALHLTTGGTPTQVKSYQDAAGPLGQVASSQGTNRYAALFSAGGGLKCTTAAGADYTAPVTTGQIVGGATNDGGLVAIFAAAGTYDVSVRFRAISGISYAKERRLWVWTKEFPSSGV